jgi:hypothetical protein
MDWKSPSQHLDDLEHLLVGVLGESADSTTKVMEDVNSVKIWIEVDCDMVHFPGVRERSRREK